MLTTSAKDTGGQLFTGVNDSGGDLAPVSMTSMTPMVNKDIQHSLAYT
jgi:hypothetical protein